MGNGSIKAYAAVVLIRIMYSVMQVVSKVALDQGMSPLVFIFYRHTAAALVLIPIAFVLERGKAKRVTLKNAGKMFIHALYGVTGCGDFFNLGLNYASATSSSALYNVQPVVGVYETEEIPWTCLWNVFQGPLIEDTSKLMNTTIQISFASVQAFVVAVAAERDFSKWKLGWNFGLAAIIYNGVIVTALSYYMQIWTIAKRGPVFLAMSMPLTLIFTIIISSFILGEAVSLGSIVAGILLIGGLFNVLWGKNLEEHDELNKIGPAIPDLEMQDKEAQVPNDRATN
uniref:WAT1-related protein n=2 Tax=Oryza TaxID=4527 RepID=Q6Z6N8_ORYSJ|nr:nodulin-like protein [Oryza sativa Japonica Group]BAD30993.1 nodulin-like protein [Oryza sativa Japonica Group]